MRASLLLLVGMAAAAYAQTPVQPQTHAMGPHEFQALPSNPADERIAVGPDDQQFGDLRVPSGAGPHPVAVLIHGGCWKADYATLRDLAPMADALKAAGVATWNVEYRRLGQPGGGWPGTYQDVAAAIDHLRRIAPKHRLDLSRVVLVGHSAGGHLAMWAASRARLPAASAVRTPRPLPVRAVFNIAGTGDMAAYIPVQQQACGGPVVEQMMGGTPKQVPERYAQSSSMRMLPLGVPQVIVWGERDTVVPASLGRDYIAAAERAGDPVEFLGFPEAGHFDIASPSAPSWPALKERILAALADRPARASQR